MFYEEQEWYEYFFSQKRNRFIELLIKQSEFTFEGWKVLQSLWKNQIRKGPDRYQKLRGSG